MLKNLQLVFRVTPNRCRHKRARSRMKVKLMQILNETPRVIPLYVVLITQQTLQQINSLIKSTKPFRDHYSGSQHVHRMRHLQPEGPLHTSNRITRAGLNYHLQRYPFIMKDECYSFSLLCNGRVLANGRDSNNLVTKMQ